MQKTRTQRTEEMRQRMGTLLDIFQNHPEIMALYTHKIPYKYHQIMEDKRSRLAIQRPAEIEAYFETLVSYNPGLTYETIMMQAFPAVASAFESAPPPPSSAPNPHSHSHSHFDPSPSRRPASAPGFEPNPSIFEQIKVVEQNTSVNLRENTGYGYAIPGVRYPPPESWAWDTEDDTLYAMIVGENIKPGDPIGCIIKKRWLTITCPANARPYSTLLFKREIAKHWFEIDHGQVLHVLTKEDVLTNRIMTHTFVHGY